VEVWVVMNTLIESLELVVEIGSENLSSDQLMHADLATHSDLSNVVLHLIIIVSAWFVCSSQSYKSH
jgi:hypothetical protein